MNEDAKKAKELLQGKRQEKKSAYDKWIADPDPKNASKSIETLKKFIDIYREWAETSSPGTINEKDTQRLVSKWLKGWEEYGK